MLLDSSDKLRHQFDIGNKSAEKVVKKNNTFTVPMPVLGEAIFKIRDKRPDSFLENMGELDRLMKIGFIKVGYIHNADAYKWAKELSEMFDDSRDSIDLADALIAGSAITDPNCSTLYTVDDKLLTNYSMLEKIEEWRKDRGMMSFRTSSIMDVLNGRK